MAYFEAKMRQIRFRLGLRPLGELTALPQTPWLDFRGLFLREKEGRGYRRGRAGEEREGKEGK